VVVGIDMMREDCLMVDGKGRKWRRFYKLDCCSLEPRRPDCSLGYGLQGCAGSGIVRFRINLKTILWGCCKVKAHVRILLTTLQFCEKIIEELN